MADYIAINLFLLLACVGLAVINGSKVVTDLVKDLMKDYDSQIRPVENENQQLNLSLGMHIIQLIDVDEKRQMITANIWLTLGWTDYRLKWDPKDHSNVTLIRIHPNRLWKPDLHLYTMADDDGSHSLLERANVNFLVQNDGTVLSIPPLIIKSLCKMDVTWFPFDSQNCALKYGSWTHSGALINLTFHENFSDANISGYLDHGEWELLKVVGTRSITFYEGLQEPYITITYTLHLRRRILFYFFNLLVPCGLIGFLALLGFTLPPNSGEKLPLGVTVLFSLIVFLNMISQTMPANSDAVPLLGTYFNCVMVMIALSVVSTIVINLNQRSINVKQIKGRSRALFLCWLPWILRMTPPTPPQIPEEGAKTEEEWSNPAKINKVDLMTNGNGGYLLDKILGREVITKSRPSEHFKLEWKFVAVVVDRICLLVSLLFAVIATTVFLISAV